ncbi:MAG: proline dehydrogenase family protein [Rhizobiales bacterium]|nr:proline dehydrogenase family protein [Hyphomicrobiales bacterium]
MKRFVAGDTTADALDASRKLQRLGITTTIDKLGENVRDAQQAAAASASYAEILREMAAASLDPNISVKLTMLGLDLGDEIAKQNLTPVLEAARSVNGFVRIDMEGSAYVSRTMAMFEAVHEQFPNEIGIVIQAYLLRARADIERMIERRARVRLVKGAYAEPGTVALQSHAEIDDNYLRLMKLLLEQGNYPAIATHDPALIAAARAFVDQKQIGRDRFEFQMLYGVRRDEQTALVADGYRMRVYVPFGTEWYPYFTRRIAERPANAFFVLRQFVSG